MLHKRKADIITMASAFLLSSVLVYVIIYQLKIGGFYFEIGFKIEWKV